MTSAPEDCTPKVARPQGRPFQPRRIPATEAAREWIAGVTRTFTEGRRRTAPSVMAALTTLLADLGHADRMRTHTLRLSLRKEGLTGAHRSLPDIVARLHSLGIIGKRRGERARAFQKQGTQTRIWLMPGYLPEALAAEDFGLSPKPVGPSVVLRARKAASPVGPAGQAVPAARRALLLATNPHLRRDMDEINEHLAAADIYHPTADTDRRMLTRTFRGSLRELGRMFGAFWIDMAKTERPDLTIGGEGVCYLDYGQVGVHIAYAMAKAVPPAGDMYDIGMPWIPRKAVKTVVAAMISEGTPLERMPKGVRALLGTRSLTVHNLTAAIEAKHPAIRHLFAKAYSGLITRVESDLAVSVLLRLKRERGIVCLPLHDGFLAAESDSEAVREVMHEQALRLLSHAVPIDVAHL